jgi:hypothetical protein
MQDLQEIRARIHEKVKTLRNIDYIISRSSFENLWILSTPDQRDLLKGHLDQGNKEGVIVWYKNHPLLEIGEQSLIQLRETAKKYCVPHYSRMNKIELLIAVHKASANPVPIPEETEDAFDDLVKLIDIMAPLCIEANIPEDYLQVPVEAKDFDARIIMEAYKWINEIYNTVYREAKSIKNLLSEEMWERYRTWNDFGDHREVILLTEALQKFRRAVVTGDRPDLFKKHKLKYFLNRLQKQKP